tara:strand:+ start:25 stop:165 length:141 start_codon:yes stop_codon:yes gene_type:complete
VGRVGGVEVSSSVIYQEIIVVGKGKIEKDMSGKIEEREKSADVFPL